MLNGRAAAGSLRLLVAAGCLLWFAAAPAMADCVSCDISGFCLPDSSSGFCYCLVKYLYGSQICVPKDPSCSSQDGCSGSGSDATRTLPIARSGFGSLVEQEPLLGLMLATAVVEGPNRSHVLEVEPWDGAIIRRAGISYRHRAMFYSARSASVPYLFVLDNLADGSSISYSGLIATDGRRVTFKKVVRASATDSGTLTVGAWNSAD
jgi:hypothetical protein